MKPVQIVLIEDNLADVLLVEMAMKDIGLSYSLTRFENGIEAVRVLCGPMQEGGVLPAAILLDLNTPRTDGFDTLLQLKQCPHLSAVPIAILTSSRSQADKDRAAIHGTPYIEKPSQLADFLSSVGQAVKKMLTEC
jgi:CheY-like chemotaxis protein